MALKILNWNVNGLNSPPKRKKVFHWIEKQKCEVVTLQEVHIKAAHSKFLLNKQLVIQFSSLAKVLKRGVVMYVKADLKPKMIFL